MASSDADSLFWFVCRGLAAPSSWTTQGDGHSLTASHGNPGCGQIPCAHLHHQDTRWWGSWGLLPALWSSKPMLRATMSSSTAENSVVTRKFLFFKKTHFIAFIIKSSTLSNTWETDHGNHSRNALWRKGKTLYCPTSIVSGHSKVSVMPLNDFRKKFLYTRSRQTAAQGTNVIHHLFLYRLMS